mmetsp:Transcript_23250/g.48336  ORF Transcript_23250/g.48336 Transcript_23250/m.48336 type:complete len:282 (-) Transcript_23250:61-906(-)
MHFLLLSIRHKFKWQIQDCSTVATIHQTSHDYASGHGSDQGGEQVIITNLTTLDIVHRDQCFIESIGFVAILIAQFATMARIVRKHHVAGLTFSHQLAVGGQNVVAGGFRVIAIVHQDGDILFRKAVHILDVFNHIKGIIVASSQFSLLPHVVDGHHNGTSSSTFIAGRHQIKGLMNIQRTATGQLRNLRKSLGGQDFAHFQQGFLKAQINVRALVVGVQDLQQGRGTGSSGSTGWIRKLKAGHIRNIRRGLLVTAARDHADCGRNVLFRLLQKIFTGWHG